MTDRLTDTTNGSIQRMLTLAKRNGWDEIADDCRAALRYRSGPEGRVP